MKIGAPELLRRDGKLLYRVPVSYAEGDGELWYALAEEHADLASDRSDAPLAALLIPAMRTGEEIRVSGTVSERLFYNLAGPLQAVLRCVIPTLRQSRILPSDVQPAPAGASGVATGFSGGIDSFCVLADHYFGDAPAGFRVTHLLYHNVGSHGPGGARLFRERHARLKPAADRMGLPYIAVDSNVADFYGDLNFQRTHTLRNASAALLLQRGLRRYMYASAFHYANTFIGPAHSMGYTDPVTLPLLSTEGLDAFSVGGGHTRVGKTLRVAEIAESHRVLDVCVRGDKARNCSTCWKCLRTLLTLEIAGLLDRYAAVFDLDAYARERERYVGEVLASDDPLLREVAAFARERGTALLPASLEVQ